MNPYVEIIFRSILSVIALVAASRLIGQKFSVIAGVSIGALGAIFSLDRNLSVWYGLTALATWSVLLFLFAIISIKSTSFRSVVNGKPTVLIENGKVLEENLRKNRVTVNDMMALLREKNAFKLSDVELGVLESDGQMSVMKKSELEPITPVLQGITVENEQMPRVVIMDGHLVKQALDDLGISFGWLMGEAMKQGAKDLTDVFLAQIDSKGNVYFDLYQDNLKRTQMKGRSLLLASLKKMQAELETYSYQTDHLESKEMYMSDAQSLQDIINEMRPYLRE
jgi:uncharacterized membrane protein YcaP (DUF421 family)